MGISEENQEIEGIKKEKSSENIPVNTPKQHLIHFSGAITPMTVHNLRSTILQAINQKAAGINLLFSTDGGDLDSALTFYNFLRALPVPLKIYNFGNVDSAGVLIYLAANERYAVDNSNFLLHNFSQWYNNQWYEYMKIRERTMVLENHMRIYAKCFEERTKSAKKPINVYDMLNGDSRIINAETAVDCGLVHQVVPPEGIISFDDVQWWVSPQ